MIVPRGFSSLGRESPTSAGRRPPLPQKSDWYFTENPRGATIAPRVQARGPGDGVRTRNLPINSRVLCQLELRRDGRYRRTRPWRSPWWSDTLASAAALCIARAVQAACRAL